MVTGWLVGLGQGSRGSGASRSRVRSEANDRLCAPRTAAYEAKMLCLCGETFKGYDPQRPPRATRATGSIALPERFREWAP